MGLLNFSKLCTILKEYFWMVIGMVIYSFGWIGCIVPSKGVGGGATGFSLIATHTLSEFFNVDIQIGTMIFIVNGILLLVAGFIIGWNFGVKTVFCIIVLSLTMNMWETVLGAASPVPAVRELFSGLDNLESFLRVILGGLIAGLGVATCFKQGGSTGGTDIVAMIINKYRTVSYGKIVIYSDFVIIASSMLVGFSLDAVIYGYVMTAVFGYTVDMLMSGSQQSSQLFIVTHDHDKMAAAIMNEIHRGVTIIDATGGYSKGASKIVMVVCRKRETTKILSFVETIDPDAFITVGSVMGVYGKGFQSLNKI